MAPLARLTDPKKEKQILVPAEQCIVLPGQIARRKLEPEQTQEMIKVAVRKPADNARLIVDEGVTTMGLGNNIADGPVRLP